jgi:hypothetical protein
VETETEACIGGGDGRCGRSEAEVEVAETVEVEAVEMEVIEVEAVGMEVVEAKVGGKSGRGGGMHWRRRHALEALECIGSARRWTELTELTEPAVNTKCWRQ